ncbi:uncharacterized protein LOC127009189 [Eriocheir sinensis]|uniref:uncharacterized protein LOC127009189 n=1 Tax=Eriocheir sinensis TaxID=95602 RepID=UPI0021C668A3|nr:uncharacterized protein LOC127009189 [Eriocheir sinensis]
MRWLILSVLLSTCCLAYGRDSEDARVAAVVRTTKTAYFLTTSTTTTPFTCALGTNIAVCQRRKFHRYASINQRIDGHETIVDGSMMDLVDEEPIYEREPRIALTMRFTTTSTLTITSTSINRALTFSLSFFCTINGASYPPACG